MHGFTGLFRLLAAITLMLLGACASAPKQTTITAGLDAQANVNPDARGRPSPVVVRVYALKSLAAFNSADFFALFDKDKETLAADLIDREEFQLKPGEKREFKKQFQGEVKYVAVIAAFRDVERARWRASMAVPTAKATTVSIKLDGNQISIAAPAK